MIKDYPKFIEHLKATGRMKLLPQVRGIFELIAEHDLAVVFGHASGLKAFSALLRAVQLYKYLIVLILEQLLLGGVRVTVVHVPSPVPVTHFLVGQLDA